MQVKLTSVERVKLVLRWKLLVATYPETRSIAISFCVTRDMRSALRRD
jgi:hypothetical protein